MADDMEGMSDREIEELRAIEHERSRERSRATPLTVAHAMEMAEAVEQRMARGADVRTAVAVVLFNFGDRFARAWCVNGEWSGVKADLTPTSGLPTCPNGHVLMQGRGRQLAWVEGDDG